MPLARLVPPGLALIAVTYGLARFAYGLFLPAISGDVALGPVLSGLIGGGSYLGYCLAVVLSALLSARLGPRRLAVTAGAVAAFGMALIAVAPAPWALAAAVLIAGTSTGLASPPLADAVAAAVEPDRQGRANTLINSGTSAGVALSAPIALAATGHWREAYLVFALAAAAVTLWVGRVVPTRGPSTIAGAGPSSPTLFPAGLARRGASPLAAAAFGLGLASAPYWTFAPDLMVAAGGLPPATAGTAWVVLGLAGFAGGAAGDLVRRFGVGRVNRGSLLGLAVAMVLLALLPAEAPAAYASAALFGAAYIMLTGVYLVWGVEVFADRPAVGLSLPFLLIAVGQVVGAPVAGVLIGLVGHVATFVAFGCAALLAMTAAPVRPAPRDARSPRRSTALSEPP